MTRTPSIPWHVLSSGFKGLALFGLLLPILAQDPPPHGYMKLDETTFHAEQQAKRETPKVRSLQEFTQTTSLTAASLPSKADILSYLTYDPAERNQGSCGNCWVWAGTALVEVELATRYNTRERLSIQHFNSFKTDAFACKGGYLSVFASWHNGQKRVIPWSNAGAAYRDGVVNDYCKASLVDKERIRVAPAYAIANMKASLIDPDAFSFAEYLNAIKAAIVDRKAVYMSYYTNFDANDGFNAWWDNQDESALWINPYEGKSWEKDAWGGHAVVVVGYDCTDADPAKHSWLVLNSWGTTNLRPHGFFRLPMSHSTATFTYTDGKSYTCYDFYTLDVTATLPPPEAPAVTLGVETPRGEVVGQPVQFRALTTGTPPLSYQWRRNGSAIPGATGAEYVLPYLQPSDLGAQIQVTVANDRGSATSPPRLLNAEGQQLLANPGFEDRTAWIATSTLGKDPYRIGADTALLAHSGLGYVFFGGQGKTGTHGISQTLTLPASATTVELSYWLRASTAETGDAVKDTFVVELLDEQGNPLRELKTYSNLDYPYLLWQQDTFNISAYKGRTVKLAARMVEDSSAYTAYRMDDVAVVSRNAVASGLQIVSPPQSLSVTAGQRATLSVQAVSGNGLPITYQWRKNGETIPGATAPSYTTQPLKVMDSGIRYSVVVACGTETLTTGEAQVSVLPKSKDLDRNGVINAADAGLLALAYGSGEENADLDGNGWVDDEDVRLFLEGL